jgi:hypothetical protein
MKTIDRNQKYRAIQEPAVPIGTSIENSRSVEAFIELCRVGVVENQRTG